MKDRLSTRTLLGYGIADFGQNIIFQATGFYLLFFYTDIFMVDAAFAGSLFLIARIWDGINDPIMGHLAQRTRSRWGTYRPYLLFASLPLAVSMILLFYAPELSSSGKLFYVAATYIFFGMAFTAYNVPYGTLTAVMTSDYHERSKLTGYRMTFAMLGGIVAAVFMLKLVEYFGGGKAGFLTTAIVFSVVMLITSLTGFFATKEKITFEEVPSTDLKKSFETLKKNKPFWLLCLAFGCCFAALGVYSASTAYFYQYYMGDASLTMTALLIMMGTTGITVPFWAWYAQRVGKRNAFLRGTLFYMIAFLLMIFIQPDQMHLMYPLLFIQGIGNGSAAFASWAMLPDTIEYGQWKTGERTAGISYGIFGFCFKLGLGLGAGMTGLVLAGLNYQPGVEQTGTVIWGIRLLMTLTPLILVTIAYLAVNKYDITPQLHQKIARELE
jgi:GPH family glycoside/pentoside/hexuronide:cation symporter